MPAPPELIGRVSLFSELESRDLQRLSQSFKESSFESGETIAAEGKGGVGFFVIGEGEATVTVHGNAVASLGPGDYFGEVALVDPGARTATVAAKTPLRCYGLTAWEFRPFVESNASVAWKLLVEMAKHLREAQQRGA